MEVSIVVKFVESILVYNVPFLLQSVHLFRVFEVVVGLYLVHNVIVDLNGFLLSKHLVLLLLIARNGLVVLNALHHDTIQLCMFFALVQSVVFKLVVWREALGIDPVLMAYILLEIVLIDSFVFRKSFHLCVNMIHFLLMLSFRIAFNCLLVILLVHEIVRSHFRLQSGLPRF